MKQLTLVTILFLPLTFLTVSLLRSGSYCEADTGAGLLWNEFRALCGHSGKRHVFLENSCTHIRCRLHVSDAGPHPTIHRQDHDPERHFEVKESSRR